MIPTQIVKAMDRPRSLPTLLRQRAILHPDRTALTFLGGDGAVEAEWTYQELDRRSRAIGRRLHALGSEGERVLLLFPAGLDFAAAFLGTLSAGAIAVPMYPPRTNQTIERLRAIASDAKASVVLTTPRILSRLDALLADAPELKALRWLAIEESELEIESAWRPVEVDKDAIAFLQYTSGSTARPKGVMVSHCNLDQNERMIQRAFEQTEQSIIVSWLPAYHDMGLIGTILQPFYTGSRAILMSPVSFLQNPFLWLETISRYKATTSGAPNFAYDLCVRKITAEQRQGLDLSRWAVAFNGSEPVRAATLAEFAATFADCGFRYESFRPCYGLAEATLLVSGERRSARPVIGKFDARELEAHRAVKASAEDNDAAPLVGCGLAGTGQKIVIANPETMKTCSAGEVGEVWVKGPNVTKGYWNQPLETARAFQARLADTNEGSFLRTGDLGFLRGGELFITGRLKDLLIIRGRNIYPQDVEQSVRQSHPAFLSGDCAAFSVDAAGGSINESREEKLVVIQEVKPSPRLNPDELIAEIKQALSDHHEVWPHAVMLIKSKGLPKTSSGKIQRRLCRKKFLAGDFKALVLWQEASAFAESGLFEAAQAAPADCSSVETIAAWLSRQLAAGLGISADQIDILRPVRCYGLDSLRAIELAHLIETELGVAVSIATLLENERLIDLASLIFSKLADTASASQAVKNQGGSFPESSPLSHGQQALWITQQMAQGNAACNVAAAAIIREAVDVPALQRAFQAVTDRHAALRTIFAREGAQVTQQVKDRMDCSFTVEDASALSEAELQERFNAEAHRPFDLECDPLARVLLFKHAPGGDRLLLVAHHIVIDFWSLGILARDIGLAYQAARLSQPIKLAPPPMDYREYVRQQNESLSGSEGNDLLAFWQRELAGELPALDLPIDRPRPPVKSFNGATEVFHLSSELASSLKQIGEVNQATPFMAVLAAFQALLHRYTRQRDLPVGVMSAGRNRADLGGIVGYFVNPLVIRGLLSPKLTFKHFLGQIREKALSAFAHGDFPFPLLVEKLQPKRDPSRLPIFDVAFNWQGMPRFNEPGLAALALGEAGVRLDLNGLVLETLNVARRAAQFDLSLTMASVGNILVGSFEYNTDLFDAATIQRLSLHFQNLLTAIAASPDQPLCRLSLLDEREQRQILVEWNQTATNETQREYNRLATIHQLFERQARRVPEAIAVVHGQQRLTYQQLNDNANQLAHRLRRLGVMPGQRVGICLHHSPAMLTAILAVLKAGGAYVPFDPAHPAAGIAAMLADARPALLLTESILAGKFAASETLTLLLDVEAPAIAQEEVRDLPRQVTGDDLAYIIYTSGSTGEPKGVMIRHNSLVNYICWASEVYLKGRAMDFALYSSLAFDLTVTSIFTPLVTGNAVRIYSPENRVMALPEILEDGQSGVLKLTPSHLSLIKERDNSGSGVRALIVGGEALETALAKRIQESFGSEVEIFNEYGPTEATVGCMIYKFDAQTDRREFVPIGGPAANAKVYVLDDQMELSPVGVSGELYLGGAGLANGYLNRPGLTAEKFLPHPFALDAGERVYRTGDVARWLPEGELEFLGRRDQQVKIRGHRIELGEIESVLRDQAGIGEAAVLARTSGGATRLVAYVAAKEARTEEAVEATAAERADLRRGLREKLPDYMTPADYVWVARLPLTQNGKVDRGALARLQVKEVNDEERRLIGRARTPIEDVVTEIWRETLGRKEIGVEDNFFELGGHSLLATQVVSRVREAFGVEL
ncbi:MAG: amino acid adenylation domain-containing protein, partial [Acidobacteriota bacterium]